VADPNDSILNTTKKLLGIDPDYDAFDMDIQIHLNSAFSTLFQLGVGPKGEFEVDGPEQQWGDFIGTMVGINSVRTYVYLSVRLIFDPPATSFAQDAMKARLAELEWRLLAAAERYNLPPSSISSEED
jgi:hypothetical protein